MVSRFLKDNYDTVLIANNEFQKFRCENYVTADCFKKWIVFWNVRSSYLNVIYTVVNFPQDALWNADGSRNMRTRFIIDFVTFFNGRYLFPYISLF